MLALTGPKSYCGKLCFAYVKVSLAYMVDFLSVFSCSLSCLLPVAGCSAELILVQGCQTHHVTGRVLT